MCQFVWSLLKPALLGLEPNTAMLTTISPRGVVGSQLSWRDICDSNGWLIKFLWLIPSFLTLPLFFFLSFLWLLSVTLNQHQSHLWSEFQSNTFTFWLELNRLPPRLNLSKKNFFGLCWRTQQLEWAPGNVSAWVKLTWGIVQTL